ncbi:membrane protein [Leisingera methylohalidivorans DSM 14336]|uniref:Methylamine utilization protein MauE n=1 Tax=Leisingera methylohalidivorans DSM 14336 TaxID=999552 RepID=V9VV81_9RHOB|nr:membrane protein [Leisingera methylohalidivorans DSM 14336]
MAREKSQGAEKSASLYRMAMPGHLCPFGLKSKSMLERKGYTVDDNLLETRDQVNAFKKAHGVEMTPVTYIGGDRIGGYTDLKRHFGYRVLGKDETTYTPVIAIFASTALMALAIVLNLHDGFPVLTWPKWFFALSMAALAIQKLQDVESFVNGFLGYDLLARRFVPYGYAYPFAELYTGVGMMALIGTGSWLIWLVAPVGIIIGTIGAISVIKAVYIDRRELTCACVGGGSNVPLGFISLTENLVMLGMGVWMLAAQIAG